MATDHWISVSDILVDVEKALTRHGWRGQKLILGDEFPHSSISLFIHSCCWFGIWTTEEIDGHLFSFVAWAGTVWIDSRNWDGTLWTKSSHCRPNFSINVCCWLTLVPLLFKKGYWNCFFGCLRIRLHSLSSRRARIIWIDLIRTIWIIWIT